MNKEPNQLAGEVEELRQRVATLEAQFTAVYSSHSWRITAPVRAAYRGLWWFLRNTRRAFLLLSWIGTGQFTRAGRALLPYYQRYIPLRIGMLAGRIRRPLMVKARIKEIDQYIRAGLPRQMKPALEYLVSGSSDSETTAVVKLAEGRRREIARMGDKKISILGSRKGYLPGQPVELVEFTMERVAGTGKNQKWGTVLYLIARGFKSSVAIELGSCAGISAIYLSSAPKVKMLITVEGSKELADVARDTLKPLTNIKVVNALFDEAFDSQFSSLESKVDFAFIDGHHEKTATIHYFDRLVPFLKSRAVVVFDDISWSSGMRDAWNVLSKRPEFAHCIDLGEMGVCVTKKERYSSEAEPKYWDLQPIFKKR